MATIQELGFAVGVHGRGARNHIVDVSGGLGVAQRSFRDAKAGVCTGFTVIQVGSRLNQRCAAGLFALNGSGELTNSHTIREWGFLDTPIVLTNTPSVGRAYDGVSEWMMKRLPAIGESESVVIPVVGECDDSVCHDPRARVWGSKELESALDEALLVAEGKAQPSLEALAQGDVGGGTGMTTFELKSGIGSASRKIHCGKQEYIVGVLLQTNFGVREQLTVLGHNIGPVLSQPKPRIHREGSCVGILATDAPLSPLGLERLAKRMGLGLARAGSHAHHGSGEIFLAVSTASESRHALEWDGAEWNPLLQAAVEASEEAVYNSLLCARAVDNSRASVAALKAEDVPGADAAVEPC
ncbi:MAG: P1 family peptidase [Deltaproteobacteria bacterium]|nr:P1 family peptidase [Deltaproteobacteria bacterium]